MKRERTYPEDLVRHVRLIEGPGGPCHVEDFGPGTTCVESHTYRHTHIHQIKTLPRLTGRATGEVQVKQIGIK